jgi:acyl carrier protein
LVEFARAAPGVWERIVSAEPIETSTVEQRLTDIWKNLLGVAARPDDSFFDLGGSSLTALTMIVEVQAAFGTEIDVKAFFETPTIATLARTIGEGG